jgi:hypothetical protein
LLEQTAYAAYLRVRDEVARLKADRPGRPGAAPSEYWAAELENIDYLIDASPLIIRKLRHHAFHITGIRPYDYREYEDRQVWFERRMQALIALAGGSDLLVPEDEALGGFGYRIDGRLYNVDTLKFFEVLVGMRRAGLLGTAGATHASPLRSERRLVWEIGAGWGGFAYQFKTLFPNTTYAIVDFPELFLFSATYLSTVFPDAVMRFAGNGAEALGGWQDADFVFIPNDRADVIRQAQPDLLVNVASFQEMTTAQVDAYARLAATAGCRALYSLNRDRSRFNTEIDSVSATLSRYYELRDIPLLGSEYIKAFKKESARTIDEARRHGHVDPAAYRHLAGALRPASEWGAPHPPPPVRISPEPPKPPTKGLASRFYSVLRRIRGTVTGPS